MLGDDSRIKKRTVQTIKKKYKYTQPGKHDIMLIWLSRGLSFMKSFPLVSLPVKKSCSNPPLNSEADIIGYKEATSLQKGPSIDEGLQILIHTHNEGRKCFLLLCPVLYITHRALIVVIVKI